MIYFFFFQAEDGIRDIGVTGVQTCALPIFIVLLYSVKSMFNLFLLTFLFAYFVDTIQDFILKRTSDFIKISPKVVTVIIYCFIAVLIVFAIDRYIPLADRKSTRLNSSHANIS